MEPVVPPAPAEVLTPVVAPAVDSPPPAEVVVLQPHVEPVFSPAPAEEVTPVVAPAVDSTPPCELVPPPPPPEPVAAPCHPPELTFEEPCPPCHCVELAVVPTDAPVSEPLVEPPAPAPSDPAPAPRPESTPILSLTSVVQDEVPAVASVPPPAKGKFELIGINDHIQ